MCLVHSWIMPFQNKIHKIEKLLGGSLYWRSGSTRSISKYCTNFFSPSIFIFKPEKMSFFCFSVFLFFCSAFETEKRPKTKLFFDFVLKWNNERRSHTQIIPAFLSPIIYFLRRPPSCHTLKLLSASLVLILLFDFWPVQTVNLHLLSKEPISWFQFRASLSSRPH